jgi:hypothetical protein
MVERISQREAQHPFNRILPFRYRLKSLFSLVTLICVAFWLATFEAGRLALAIVAVFVVALGGPYLLIAAFSWVLGTPGERQLRRRNLEQDSARETETSDV